MLIYLIGYLVLCAFIALFGKKKINERIKFFFITVFLTPITGIILLIMQSQNQDKRIIITQYRCKKCGFEYTEEDEYCQMCAEKGHKIPLTKVTRKVI